MENVSQFEANLLRLLYYFLRREPAERALPLVEARPETPACLSRGAVRLVQDALARGSTWLLGQRGGWRVEKHLRGDRYREGERTVEGRLWQRTRPAELGLTFSAHSMEFLIWITACRPGDREPAWEPPEDTLTLGDRLLLFFAHEGLRETAPSLGYPEMLLRKPLVQHGLCWLAYPEDFHAVPAGAAGPSFPCWTSGVGACILEALQTELAQRWIQIEGNKERIIDPRLMLGHGNAQERVLNAFLGEVYKLKRLDLARFLLQAAGKLLTPHAHSSAWIGGLQTAGLRLAERAAVYQAALVLVRQMERFRDWTRWARSIGYLDEEYTAAQLWLADWEHYQGDTLVERALVILRQVDPMRQVAGTAPAGTASGGAAATATGE
jgi:hypothetical protein